jgi:polyphosphate kinase 2 (PPK2 family)
MAHQSKTLLFIKEATKKMLRAHVKEMSELQNVLYASNRYAVLLIFQAMDAAGKDSAIKHVMSGQSSRLPGFQFQASEHGGIGP